MDLEQTRQYLAQVDAMRADFLRATGARTPTADRVAGALTAYLGPRLLALDAVSPGELRDITGGLDRHNFRSHRHVVADRVRRLVRGKLGRDGIEDLDALLAHLCEEEEGEGPDGMDHGRRRARDADPERPGFEPSRDPAEDPWPEAEDFLDEELESMRGELGEDAYRRLRAASDRRHRDASDRRRHGRDRSPYENFDARRRRAEDDPSFAGAPRPGGGMLPMENANIDRPGFGQPADPAARDRRPGFRHARQFGQDSAPTGFASRFKFTQRATTEGQSRIPGRAGGVY